MSEANQLPPVDSNVRIPKAVKDAAEKANTFYKKPENPPGISAPEPAPPEKPVEVAEKPAEPAPEPKPVEAAPPPAPPPAPVTQPVTPDYEHLYKSWKGRYDAEVPRLRSQVAALEAAIRERPQPPRETREERMERLITDKDLEDYGPDLLDVVGKKAKEEFNPLVQRLQRQISQLESRLQGVGTEVVKTARERLYVTLDDQVPDWRQLDEDPKFLNWLQLPDTYSGAIRHELLSAAYERNDAPRVVAFFRGFLAEEAANSPAKAEPVFPPPAAAPEKIPLESLAAPGRAKSTAASAPVEKPIITRAQITKLYADKAAGRWRGKEAEFDRLEQMVYDAQRDGRIQ
jgi:ElaB/YqjD/DUF883 family membrane-anchored ribosome-binding protein